jgi:hypothetical protein
VRRQALQFADADGGRVSKSAGHAEVARLLRAQKSSAKGSKGR